MMNDLPGNYDAWKTGPFGRFERDQDRKDSAYAEALSARDNELRTNPLELDESFADAVCGITHFEMHKRFVAILQAAATHKPPREIGEALTRLVNDIIRADAERFAEEETR